MIWDTAIYLIEFYLNWKRSCFNISIVNAYTLTEQSMVGEIDKFYCTLDNAKAQCKLQEITVVMGNLNAKVGNEWDGETVCKFEPRKHN